MTTAVKITEKQKRSVACPTCGRARGRACRSSRQPGPNTFGGGWGGPPDLDRAHDARREAAKAYMERLAGHGSKRVPEASSGQELTSPGQARVLTPSTPIPCMCGTFDPPTYVDDVGNERCSICGCH